MQVAFVCVCLFICVWAYVYVKYEGGICQKIWILSNFIHHEDRDKQKQIRNK